MRRLRFNVAVSLDGFIADANGAHDWVVMDPDVDFTALFQEFDVAVMGRRTFESALAQGSDGSIPGLDVIVFSTKLRAEDHPAVRIENGDPVEVVAALKEQPGKDVWLFGGSTLFGTLLDAGLVDRVEVSFMPVMLGEGIRLLDGSRPRVQLAHVASRTLHSGVVTLTYDVLDGGRSAVS